ncbi:hypothetical protein [Brevibacillus marinus]|uniref:hypothetical protein n=1 Tax=Brevibacillus marinus TaxID=2496837 RepID=UPI000F84BC14|nr:hypothetical protein [Brevibacillus marinus]
MKHLTFAVNLQDAVRLSNRLQRLGIRGFYIEPAGEQVAFVFARVSECRKRVLLRIFGADGESRQTQ